MKPSLDEIRIQNSRWKRIEEIDKEIDDLFRETKTITYGVRYGLVEKLNDYEKADLKEIEVQLKKLYKEREMIMETLSEYAIKGIKEMQNE